MYNFVDVNEASEEIILPSEALNINGDYIEHLIPGYRTLQVTGREAMTAELLSYETGNRDGSVLVDKRYPARYITVKYQLLCATPEEFRESYNKLASILNVTEAKLIFNDEPDKYFTGTPEEVGEPEGGRNSVTSEFVLFCADPFKYSVEEYEVEPERNDNEFLLNYKGTYKSYPTLEAEFYNENEAVAALTGHGDCGYVAFFNENEKIIQLGNPDETNTENYAASQTLVSQKFESGTAWGTVAQTNWAMNNGKISLDSLGQTGSVAMKVATYTTTQASATTSGTLLNKRSTQAKPYVDYSISAQATSRQEDRITVKVTITAALVGSSGTTITAGAKVTLNKTKLYSSATASSDSGTKSGDYYLWDASTNNGRIRITNSKSNVGKSGQITGWVNVSDVNLSTSNALGTGYGLKGGIQINGGDWNYVTIKAESAKWSGSGNHTVTLNVLVKNIDATTTRLEDIKFKVERTDNEESKVGLLDETLCNDLEISNYNTPVPETWYLMPQTYGTGSDWHGPSITRRIPADASGEAGSQNWAFSWAQKMSIGSSSSATQEVGEFQALLVSGSGSNRKIVAGVNIYKGSNGNTGNVRFYVNGKTMQTMQIDFSYHNKYFGNNNASKGIRTVKTSSIVKVGGTISFNIGGIQKTFIDASVANEKVTEITFYFAQHGTKPTLSCNGLYWAKFVKNNCDTYADIPNKFSANDVVTADCKSGEVFLNNSPAPSLGALGNDWEEFYLTPGLNQIGFAYSDWVSSAYAPKFRLRYREVYI